MKKILFVLTLLALYVLPAMAGDNIKTNYRTALVMAYSQANSVYEDDNLKLEIYNEQLWATNKTNRAIFIDLSQCFLIHNGSSYPMFDSAHQNEQNASKKNVSTSIEDYVSIAPSVGVKQNETKVCNLASNKLFGRYTTTETPGGKFTDYDERLLTLINDLVNESLEADPKGKNYLGTAYRHLTEDESINNIGASIAYAFNKKAEEWTPVTISTWVSDVYLAPYYVEMPPEFKDEDRIGFGVKKTEAAKICIKADSPFEFAQDRSPLLVCDWVGDFKTGTFELLPTWISKVKGLNFGKLFVGLATGGLAFLAMDLNQTYYKKEINFVGQDANWGKMSYMTNRDLSKFNNKR
ncbi:MAG: hypothetical protein NC342_03285 [Pseudoflavonifractor sp.]|nr:hypothetical protein [Alloprevotella sp.]MCM1116538.1 hypothetical protein [Pseudoflavonifractor sp.]